MKKLIFILLLNTIILGTAQAQNLPAGMRVEVAEDETDHGEYSIFEYKDSDDAESFGYYLSLGRVTDFLGADEILGMEVTSTRSPSALDPQQKKLWRPSALSWTSSTRTCIPLSSFRAVPQRAASNSANPSLPPAR